MNPLDRRAFLAGGLTAGAALAASAATAGAQSAGSLGGGPVPSTPPVTSTPPPTPLPGLGLTPTPLGADGGILVMVTLYGGNDGLNTVVPFADPVYQSSRPGLAYSAEEVLHLDDRVGFGPTMTGLHGLWGHRNVAVVRGVGYPKPDRSHFRSMDIWQSGSPLTPLNSGWLGRWLDRSATGPLGAVHLGSTLPMLVTGERRTAAVVPVGGDASASAATRSAVVGLSGADATDGPLRALLRDSLRLETSAAEAFDPLMAGQAADDATVTETSGASAGGQGGLEFQMRVVARAIRAGLPTRVYSVALGGFDHHSAERTEQARLMGVVDRAVTGLFTQLAGHPSAEKVVVAVYSEFGRRVAANASDGTDHGAASPVLLVGAPVRAGFHGDDPDLRDLDDGDLKYTVDFRDVYHELTSRVLRTDPDSVLDPGRRDLGVLL